MARRWLTITVCLAFMSPAAAEGSPQHARQIRALKQQVLTLKATVTRWHDLANETSTKLEAVTKERDSARFDLMSAQVDNNNLRAGLPDAIKAVPTGRFWELIFAPLMSAWRCGSIYTSPGYWSVEFTSDC